MGGLIGGLLGGGQSDFVAQQAQLNNPVTQLQVGQGLKGAQGALNQMQDLTYQAKDQNGFGNQQGILNQQQQLANQLRAQSMGQGPNPALMQLAQQTGNNIQGQAALMAGQRGAGANAGLMARQAAQMGAGVEQQAVGQAGVLQAQQQLAAQQQLQAQQASMQQVAGQQVGQQMAATGALNSAAQGLYGQQLNAYYTGQGQQLQNVQQANAANAGVQAANSQASGQMLGGLFNGIGAGATKMMGFASGGEVPPGSPRSSVGRYCQGGMMKSGGKVPGQARVAGDSRQNDVVKAVLSPGEIVLPRSVTMSKDPAGNAAKFVAAIKAKERMGK